MHRPALARFILRPCVALILLGLGCCAEVPNLPKACSKPASTADALSLVDTGGGSSRTESSNGLQVGAIWKIQKGQGGTCAVDVSDSKMCGDFLKPDERAKPGDKYGGTPACTNDETMVDPLGHNGENADFAHVFLRFVSALGPLQAHRKHWSQALLGHVTWWPVTYTGNVSFNDAGGADRDMSFALEPDGSLAPVTLKQRAPDFTLECPQDSPGQRCLGGTPRLHLEINGSQSTKHLKDDPTELFQKLSTAELPESRVALRGRIFRKPAIATGLLSLDLDHEIFAELHPLYSLAWRDTCGEQDGNTIETWAVLFANTGHQGWVSSGLKHYLALDRPSFIVEFPSALPNQDTIDPTKATAEVQLRSNSTTVSYSTLPVRHHVALKLAWKGRVTDEVRVHGTVKLTWPSTVGKCQHEDRDTPTLTRAPKAAHRVEDLGGTIRPFLASRHFKGASELDFSMETAAGDETLDGSVVPPCTSCDDAWTSPLARPSTCPSRVHVCDLLEQSTEKLGLAVSSERDVHKTICDALKNKEKRARIESAYREYVASTHAPTDAADSKMLDRLRQFACQ